MGKFEFHITSQQWDRVARCPFCGNGLHSVFIMPVSYDYEEGFYVGCEMSDSGCGGSGPIKETIDEAIDAWNGKYLEVDMYQCSICGQVKDGHSIIFVDGKCYCTQCKGGGKK